MYIYSECRPDLTDATLADFKDAAAWLVVHAEDRDRVSHMPGKDRVAKMLKEVSLLPRGYPGRPDCSSRLPGAHSSAETATFGSEQMKRSRFFV